MGQPMPQAAILRHVVVDQQGVGAGLTDHQRVVVFAVLQQGERAGLVRVEFADGVFVEEAAHEATEIAGVEPGLGFEPERVEWAVVAGE